MVKKIMHKQNQQNTQLLFVEMHKLKPLGETNLQILGKISIYIHDYV
jgi:hypothetical protein